MPGPGLKQFEMRFWVGGETGHAIIGAGFYNLTITDLSTGRSTWYKVSVYGIGVSFPVFRGSSMPVTFFAADPKTSSSFEGYGYLGGASLEVFAGFKFGGGIKIPNGPFIPGEWFTRSSRDVGGFNIGVSHNLTYWGRCD
jgi:hypothetical protein